MKLVFNNPTQRVMSTPPASQLPFVNWNLCRTFLSHYRSYEPSPIDDISLLLYCILSYYLLIYLLF